MNEELVKKACQLFDTKEKWDAFLELVNIKGTIQYKWWQMLLEEVYRREALNGDSNWEIDKWGTWDIRWVLKEYGRESLSIHFFGRSFRVYYFGNKEDLKSFDWKQKADIIRNGFDRLDGYDDKDGCPGWEDLNFSFGTVHDGRIHIDQLAWFAGHETEKFAEQLIKKVRKFQTPEMTTIFRDINNSLKKKPQN